MGQWTWNTGKRTPSRKQRFVRLDAVRQQEGNGLGLSLVDAIARQHGAALLFEDNEPDLRAVIRFQTDERG
jgi:signal transduction histidine kinase